MSSFAFNNLRISIRTAIGFSLLLALMLVLLIVGTVNLAGIQRRLDGIVHDNKVKIELVQEMRFIARHEAVLIRNILLLREAGQKENEIKRRAEAQKNYQAAEDKLSAMTRDEGSAQLLTKMVEGRQATRPLWDKVVQLGLANKPDAGIQFLITEVRKVQWKWLDTLDEMGKAESKRAEESADQADRAYRRAWNFLIGFGAASLALGIFIAVMITRGITRPLALFARDVAKIAQGDLTTVIPCDTRDELGVLGRQLNGMTEAFDKTIHSMLVSVTEVVQTVSVLKARSVGAAEGARNQSGHASQIATAAEEMSQTITDISKNASSVAAAATEAKDTAAAGQEITETAIGKVNSVHDSTNELAGRVETLNKKTGEISEIATLIKGIADQTNLLALNAAIEAARAGEQGRGFSVVADEVRKLAERTIKATTDISDKIASVQEESRQTATVMKKAAGEVSEARDFIGHVGAALKAVVGTVQKVSDQIARVAVAVEEQSAASEEISANIEKTSVISKEVETMSGDVMHEVEGLTRIAEQLRNSAAGFKTRAGKLLVLDLAKTDHRLFMEKVGVCLQGGAMLDQAQLPDHKTCRFGKWYLDEGRASCGAVPSFVAVDAPHARIHAMAKDAVSAFKAGDKGKAEHIFRDMEDVSVRIANLLDQIKVECKI